MTRLEIGLSTCPNATVLFAPLLDGRVDTRGLDLRFRLGDIQELNESLAKRELEVSKASFAAALQLAEHYGVLRVGSALGFGVGPVLLGRPGAVAGQLPEDAVVLCPGEATTATLLMRCLHAELTHIEHRRFDEIMPALVAGEADAGVCIHEGRFTYRDHDLLLLEDLGDRWENETGQPVPLGGLLCRLDVPLEVVGRLQDVLRDSLAQARAEPEACLPTMRRYAQELSDEVIWRHVELYVNDQTSDLGITGRRCLDELARRAGAYGPLVVFD
jgi:1,4-dihydroxy-6-naphthoate synthase